MNKKKKQINIFKKYSHLGKYIKSKRKKYQIGLCDFCLISNIDPAILSRIENLKQDIKLNVLIKIAQGFNQSPAEFLAEFEKLI